MTEHEDPPGFDAAYEAWQGAKSRIEPTYQAWQDARAEMPEYKAARAAELELDRLRAIFIEAARVLPEKVAYEQALEEATEKNYVFDELLREKDIYPCEEW